MLLLAVTVLPFFVTIEGVDSDSRSLWVLTTVVLGLLYISLGYSQRPKTKAQTCQQTVTTTQATIRRAQTVAVETAK